MVKAHDNYLALMEPEQIQKVESMTNTMHNRGFLDPRIDEYATSAFQIIPTSEDGVAERHDWVFKSPSTAQSQSQQQQQQNTIDGSGRYVTPFHVNIIPNEHEPECLCASRSVSNVNTEKEGDYCGSDYCRHRSDSTFDGAPSADVVVACRTEMRKIGSSSSGSTSSSKGDCYSEDDYSMTEDDSDDEDYTNIRVRGKEEVETVVAVVEQSAEKVLPIAVSATRDSADRIVKNCPVPAVRVNEQQPLPSCPQYLARHPGPLPVNIYQKGFFIGVKNIISPPSDEALRMLQDELRTC